MTEIIKWKKGKDYNPPDVTINISAPHGSGKVYGLVTFRNNVWKRFNSDYVKLTYEDKRGRLYMIGSDRKEGYRMFARSVQADRSKNRYMRIGQKAFTDMVKDLIGDYDFQYDKRRGAFYVEVRQ